MNELLTLIKAAACVGIFWRIYTYHWPRESTYRIGITSIAYLLMFLAGGQSISLVMGSEGLSRFLDLGVYAAILAIVLMAKGNVAWLLRVDFTWTGEERRRMQ